MTHHTPMIAHLLLGLMVLADPVHAQQSATAIGPCATAVNASGQSRVDVVVHCTAQDEALARKLIRKSEQKQRRRDLTQDAATSAIRKQIYTLLQKQENLEQEIEFLTATVASLREQAQAPNSSEGQKDAYAKLQSGDTQPAVILLGERADTAAQTDASQRDAAIAGYRKQAALLRLSDTTQALQSLEKALQLAPDDTVVLLEAGDLAMVLGRTTDAARYYQRMHSLNLRATEKNLNALSRQQALWASHIKLGDVLVIQGDLAAAQQHYTSANTIFEHLIEQTPENIDWQRGLWLTQISLGDVQQAMSDLPRAQRHYAAALSIAEPLAERDPTDSGWQRFLSFSHELLGDVQQARGSLRGARRHYIIAHEITERLVAQDPLNSDWNHDLSVTYSKVGNIEEALGNLASARRHYIAGLAIDERLTAKNPENSKWRHDLAVSRIRLAGLCVRERDASCALVYLRAARAVLQALRQRKPNHAKYLSDLTWVDQRIASIEGRAVVP